MMDWVAGLTALAYSFASNTKGESFGELLDGLPVGVYRTSPDGRILRANAAMVEILGYPDLESLLAVNAGNIYADPALRARLREASERRDEIKNLELQVRRHDGTCLWVRKNMRVMRDSKGRVAWYQGTIEDINDRKLAEEALSQLRHRLDVVIGAAPVLLFAVDGNGVFTLYEGRGAQRFGARACEVVGRSIWSIERNSPEVLDGVRRALAGAEWCNQVERSDSVWDASYGPLRDGEERIAGAICVATEVTGLRQAERERDQIFTLSHDLFAVADYEGSLKQLNPAWEHKLGFSREELSSRPFIEFVHPHDRELTMALWRNVIEGGAERPLENRLLRKDGGYRWISWTAVAVPAARICYCAGRDVTERKWVEQEMARARDSALEAVRLKTTFLANMSHEIRTPLHVILGYSELLEQHLSEIGDNSQAATLEGIQRAGKRLADTIQSVLDFSKLDANAFEVRPRPLALGAFVQRQVDECRSRAEEKAIELVCQIEEPGVEITFDEYCLSQALLNLIDNAIKFTLAGGVTVRLYRDGARRLCLDVADTGVGIAPHYLHHLFEPFSQEENGYRRQFEGSGLGLALVRRYLELNGATISVESNKERGSRFTIHFGETALPQPNQACGA